MENRDELTEHNLIKAMGLDPAAPYCLGNKMYYYERECNSGHKNLTDEEIAFASETYDGYRWTVPVCKRCIGQNINPRIYSHESNFHLKQIEDKE